MGVTRIFKVNSLWIGVFGSFVIHGYIFLVKCLGVLVSNVFHWGHLSSVPIVHSYRFNPTNMWPKTSMNASAGNAQKYSNRVRCPFATCSLWSNNRKNLFQHWPSWSQSAQILFSGLLTSSKSRFLFTSLIFTVTSSVYALLLLWFGEMWCLIEDKAASILFV